MGFESQEVEKAEMDLLEEHVAHHEIMVPNPLPEGHPDRSSIGTAYRPLFEVLLP